jgi:nitric oxide reductase large subunit
MSEALSSIDATLSLERIIAHQKAHALSDVEMVRKFPLLGSARSWGRLAALDFTAAPLDKWSEAIQQVFAEIEGRSPIAVATADAPISLVGRHLAEADRCRREGHIALAKGHCRTARQAIEQYQRQLLPGGRPGQTPGREHAATAQAAN